MSVGVISLWNIGISPVWLLINTVSFTLKCAPPQVVCWSISNVLVFGDAWCAVGVDRLLDV